MHRVYVALISDFFQIHNVIEFVRLSFYGVKKSV